MLIVFFLFFCVYVGLFLCGGLTPKNIDLIKDPSGLFMTALLDKVGGILDLFFFLFLLY